MSRFMSDTNVHLFNGSAMQTDTENSWITLGERTEGPVTIFLYDETAAHALADAASAVAAAMQARRVQAELNKAQAEADQRSADLATIGTGSEILGA